MSDKSKKNWLPLKLSIVAVLAAGLLGYSRHGSTVPKGFFRNTEMVEREHMTSSAPLNIGTITLTREWSEKITIDAMGGENIYWGTEQGVNGEVLANGTSAHPLTASLPPGTVTVRFRVIDREKALLAYYICRGKPPGDWYNIALLAR